jgi:dUTP pyrophosphatase
MEVHTILIWSESNRIPTYATTGSSGFDIQAKLNSDMTISRGEIVMIPTGLKFAIPRNQEVQIRSRSGLTLNHGIVVTNSPGTIDSDYRGEVCVLLTNLKDVPFVVKDGMKIAQGVLCPVSKAAFILTDNLSATERNAGGFGSTGI